MTAPVICRLLPVVDAKLFCNKEPSPIRSVPPRTATAPPSPRPVTGPPSSDVVLMAELLLIEVRTIVTLPEELKSSAPPIALPAAVAEQLKKELFSNVALPYSSKPPPKAVPVKPVAMAAQLSISHRLNVKDADEAYMAPP